MNTLDDVQGLWNQIAQRQFSNDPSKPLMLGGRRPSDAPIAYAQDLSYLFRNDIGLGEMPRLFVIIELLGQRRGDFFSEVSRAVRGDRHAGSGNLQKILQLGHAKPSGFGHDYHAAIEDKVNNWRKSKQLDTLPPGTLFGMEFKGPSAIADYQTMLSQRWQFAQPLIDRMEFIESGEREEFARRIEDALEDGPDKPMLINIHGSNLWAGLAACSSWLADTVLRSDSREVLVIPLRQWKAPNSANILNSSQILGYLRAFVSETTVEQIRIAAPIRDKDGFFDVVHEIRSKLAIRPRVIIFDGHHTGPEMSLLERRIADDYLESLIMRLMEPPLGGQPPVDLQRFRSNRIVVMSDVRFDEDWRRQLPRIPRMIAPRTISLPSPDAERTYPIRAVLCLWLKVKILFVAIRSERQGASREFSQDRFAA